MLHKKVLYFGNMLSKYGKTPTSVETLGEKLSEIAIVKRYSEKKGQLARMLDFFFATIRFGPKVNFVLIDTYSTFAFYYAFFISVFLKLFRVNYIPILHGGNLPFRLERSKWMSKFLFRNAFINVAPSGYLRTSFEKAGFSVLQIPNYIDIQDYPFLQRDSVRPRILWVRSFHRIYQPDLAIQVFDRLRIHFPEAKLCMVGPDKDGSLERCKRLAADKGLQEAVHFTGRMDKKDWIALSGEFDIFLNTTSVDNTPVSVMEAMALGMIVVTTKVGGIPWLFENERHGFMVDMPFEDEIINKLLTILDQKNNYSNISSQARKKAEEWDWGIISGQWAALFNS